MIILQIIGRLKNKQSICCLKLAGVLFVSPSILLTASNLFTKPRVACYICFLTSPIRSLNEIISITGSQLLQVCSRVRRTSFSAVKNLAYLQADKERISTSLGGQNMSYTLFSRAFNSRDQQPDKYVLEQREIGCIRKEFNFHRIGLLHQHGRPFHCLGVCVLERFLDVNDSQVPHAV